MSAHFTLKRALVLESKEKLKRDYELYGARGEEDDCVCVHEWLDDDESIIGRGCYEDFRFRLIKPRIEPGLFVVSKDVGVLQVYAELNRWSLLVYPEFKYTCNNFVVGERLYDASVSGELVLCKIVTKRFKDAIDIHTNLKYNVQAYKYVNITHYYDATKQVMFELMVLNRTPYVPQQNVEVWFDRDLKRHTEKVDVTMEDLPTIAADFETVARDKVRLPMGSARDDILYTAAFLHTEKLEGETKRTMYSLALVPASNTPKRELKQKLLDDGYLNLRDESFEYTQTEEHLLVFKEERVFHLAVKCFMTMWKKGTTEPLLHVFLGYNSSTYDMTYGINRLGYFNMCISDFVWLDGYCVGHQQIHIDMLRVMQMTRGFNVSNKLDDVCKEILGMSKTGINAVNLRNTFFKMKDETHAYIEHKHHTELEPSLLLTLQYNNVDTVLVAELEAKTKSIHFLVKLAKACQIPLTKLNAVQRGKQYILWNQTLVMGLAKGHFNSTFKSNKVNLKCDVYDDADKLKVVNLFVDSTDNLNGEVKSLFAIPSSIDTKKKSFPGGLNFCLGEYSCKRIQIYDYETAYPTLMEKLNISDETLGIYPASAILKLCYSNELQDMSDYRTFDYMTHTARNKSLTQILHYQYIYENEYCGGEFPFTVEELVKRRDAPVIIIWQARPGHLTEAIKALTKKRVDTKEKCDVAGTACETLRAEVAKLVANRRTFSLRRLAAPEDDDDDYESEEEAEEAAPAAPAPAETFEWSNPRNFKFVNTHKAYITLGANEVCSVKKDFEQQEDALELLRQALKDAEAEHIQLYTSFSLQKIKVSSFYGCLSKANPVIGAAITCLTRSYLLLSGQFFVAVDRLPMYCDTDSVMLGLRDTDEEKDFCGPLNTKYPIFKMKMKEVVPGLLTKKKVMYKENENGEIMFSQNKNGPGVWKAFGQYIFRQTYITTNDDIYRAFYEFYMKEYAYLKTLVDTSDGLVNPELVERVSHNIRTKASYKTSTPASKYMSYLRSHWPGMATAGKHSVFYLLKPPVTQVVLRPVQELKSVKDLHKINLYKHYQNMNTTAINLIKHRIKINNEPYNVTVTSKNITLKHISGFDTANNHSFP